MARIYFVNGFLDSGKTSFIKALLSRDDFKINGTTLLLECEEGDEEYDTQLLADNNVVKITIDNYEDFNPDNIMLIEDNIHPERIIIEFNGMWSRKNLVFPWYWDEINEVCIIDATTFELYSRNMKSMVAEQVRTAGMTIFNQCDGMTDKLSVFNRSIKAVNPYSEIFFCDKNGTMSLDFKRALPYDLTRDELDILDENYAAFYLDIMDDVDRYLGKKVHLIGMVIKKSDDNSGSCIFGRLIMTCCAEDLSMFGFICKIPDDTMLKPDDWVSYCGVIEKEYNSKYDLWYPVINVETYEQCEVPENPWIDVL
ncbi:CobW/HypB/UreG, nucleotide-binding domain-containing protein [Lachnospiraceae bacterium JC7]|nr:CobW/HypB/UreG, nucleotide-binding domain-containing protein [Lachnospiraceae bacterium JC7]